MTEVYWTTERLRSFIPRRKHSGLSEKEITDFLLSRGCDEKIFVVIGHDDMKMGTEASIRADSDMVRVTRGFMNGAREVGEPKIIRSAQVEEPSLFSPTLARLTGYNPYEVFKRCKCAGACVHKQIRCEKGCTDMVICGSERYRSICSYAVPVMKLAKDA